MQILRLTYLPHAGDRPETKDDGLGHVGSGSEAVGTGEPVAVGNGMEIEDTNSLEVEQGMLACSKWSHPCMHSLTLRADGYDVSSLPSSPAQ